jgi:hypothetical protein
MTRDQAQQLALPCSLDAAMQLRDELTKVQAIASDQQDTIGMQRDTIAYLENQLSREQAAHRRTVDRLALAECELTLARLRLVQQPAPHEHERLDRDLRRLLVLAHPDKWGQGQPATELAHEVAAALNTLRQRLGEGQA